MSNSKLSRKFQPNILIFEARASLQTLLLSLKQEGRKWARLGNIPKQPSLTFKLIKNSKLARQSEKEGTEGRISFQKAFLSCIHFLCRAHILASMRGPFTWWICIAQTISTHSIDHIHIYYIGFKGYYIKQALKMS